MKVRELIAELEKMDREGEMLVVLSGDAEGNKMSPLSELYLSNYSPVSTWEGELVSVATKNSVKCIVFVPIN